MTTPDAVGSGWPRRRRRPGEMRRCNRLITVCYHASRHKRTFSLNSYEDKIAGRRHTDSSSTRGPAPRLCSPEQVTGKAPRFLFRISVSLT